MLTYFVALIQYKFVQVLGNANNNLNLVNVYSDGNGNGAYCKGNSINQLKNLVFPSGKLTNWNTIKLELAKMYSISTIL